MVGVSQSTLKHRESNDDFKNVKMKFCFIVCMSEKCFRKARLTNVISQNPHIRIHSNVSIVTLWKRNTHFYQLLDMCGILLGFLSLSA